jgi:hypothetical protein
MVRRRFLPIPLMAAIGAAHLRHALVERGVLEHSELGV